MASPRGRGAKHRGGARRGVDDHTRIDDHFNGTGELNSHISEKFKGRRVNPPITSPPSYSGDLDLTLNKEIRQYVHEQEKHVQVAEVGDWRGLPEIPTTDEISLAAGEEVTLIPNKVKGKWKTKDKYLKAHYELHREDAVSPLRDAVDKFRKDPDMSDDKSLHIYEKVHICGFTFSQLGIAARVTFSTARAGRHILWQSSKRLVSGTLVALTPADNKFETKCLIALVAARPLAGVQLMPSEVDLFFCRTEDIHIDPQQEWTMVEASTGYYEAYRHTLRALQKLSHESFTLSPHICSMSPAVEPPAYLKACPTINLAPATAEGQDEPYDLVDVLTQWPDHSRSTLDESQWSALKQALTNSLAIMQGPPGTGKTFCSKVALEILHGYLKNDDPPIIIAAQTNHALDQLLGHVSKFEPNYIRLGGRSTNIDVKKRALWEVRSKEVIPPIPGGFFLEARSNYSLQTKQMITVLEPLHHDVIEPISTEVLAKHGVISQKQSESLVAVASRWARADKSTPHPLQLWLDRQLIPFEVNYRADNFMLNEEDEDLEIEQLREHEAEHGVNDEEDAAEMLRGSWRFLQDNWTVLDPVETDLELAAKELNTKQDLYKVSERLRGPLFKLMQQRLKAVLQEKFRQLATAYEKNLKDLKIGKWERDAVFLKRARIIGLTTTGLSKYRPLLSSLKPKIVLIEEAAEVLEAPVTVACMESVEHLILVGDHQQLQGHCSVRELEGYPYYLNVSLFERLVNNGIPYKTLLQQRRMDPSFRKLIQGLYPGLEDHSSVTTRDSINWGMGKIKSFFFSHQWFESRDSQMSTYNQEEAKFVAGFYRYLTQNGVPPSAITLLTFYNGQRKRLLKEIRAFPELAETYNLVKTVDSYQGEENDIVLLSLARNNSDGQIGFLDISNRVCVALSRAKLGFYIFGNADLLAKKNKLWDNVVATMSQSRRLAEQQFPIFCEKHDVTSILEYPDEWNQYNGGCVQPCGLCLPCGHECLLKCHPFPHDKVFCGQKCERQLACGHECQDRCSEVCSCNCPDFAEAQRQAWEPSRAFENRQSDGAGHEYHDVRREQAPVRISIPGMDGKYISGQQNTHSHSRSTSYLPEQVPNFNEVGEPGATTSNWGGTTPNSPAGTMRHQAGMLAVRTRNTPAGSGTDYFPAKKAPQSSLQDEVVQTSWLSPEEQAWSRQGWKKFSAGGVKKDDERRQNDERQQNVWSDDMPGPSMQLRDFPTLQKTHQSQGIEEKTQVLRDGRSKYTQEYQPAGYTAAIMREEIGKGYPVGKGKKGELIEL